MNEGRNEFRGPMKDKPNIVIFLDVDGVLNRCGKSSQGLETDKCDLLAEIVRATGAGIVVSSTWRKMEHQRERLVRLFYQIEAVCMGWTPVLEKPQHSGIYTAPERGVEIQAWLDAHPDVVGFVIIDDGSDMAHLMEYLVQTESYTGLTREIADAVIQRLLKK